jgi:hypothetical protein
VTADASVDESTLGGYVARHARPPAFEGVDGLAYTADIATADTDDAAAPIGAYLLFVRWGGSAPAIRGHLESEFLARGSDVGEVRATVERLTLLEVKRTLDALIGAER